MQRDVTEQAEGEHRRVQAHKLNQRRLLVHLLLASRHIKRKTTAKPYSCSRRHLTFQELASSNTGLPLCKGCCRCFIQVSIDRYCLEYRDKPVIASDGEKILAFYNIACCLSQTGNIDDGLLALLEALSMGYDDYQQIRTDQDLKKLITDKRFEPLMQKFQKVSRKGLLQDFFSNI